MPVDRHNAVCVFIYNDAVRVHAEGTYIVFEFFGAVYDFAFIELICQMRENNSRNLYAHADIHAVGFGRDVQLITDFFHPFAAAAAY